MPFSLSRHLSRATIGAMAVNACVGVGAQPDGSLVRVSVDTFLVTRFENARVVQTDTVIQRFAFVDLAGTTTLLQVYTQRDHSGYPLIDSLWMRPSSLLPVLHRRTSQGSVVDLQYDSGRILGRVGFDGRATQQIDTILNGIVFDAAALDAVARAMPISTTSEGVLRFYVPGVGVYPLRLRVAGRDTIVTRAGLRREAWRLSGTFGNEPINIAVAVDNHDLLALVDGPPVRPNLTYHR